MTSAYRPDLFRVSGRVTLVTGASSGLGRRMAEVLHGAGARIAILSRRMDRLEELAEKLPGTLPIECDLAHPESLPGVVATVERKLGRVEILVNNAAIGYGRPAHEETLDKIQTVATVNLVSPYRLAQLVYPGMENRGSGCIVNVTSIAAHVGVGTIPQGAYAASKGGLLALTRELATQWGPSGIRVNAIAPGFARSEMTDGLLASERLSAYVIANSPLGRFGDPSDLDGALLYLCSDASSFMTGQTLLVDGGWTAR